MTNWPIPSEGKRQLLKESQGIDLALVFHNPTSLAAIARENFRHEAQTVLKA